MTQVMLAFVARLDPERLSAAQAEIDRMGNPPNAALRARIDGTQGELGVHFMSLHALPSATAGRAHLVLEVSADGPERRAIGQIVQAMGEELRGVFAFASDWEQGGDLAAYLTAHLIRPGFRWSDPPGLAHIGVPGMTVGRIRTEADLALWFRDLVAAQPRGLTALQRVKAVREALGPDHPGLTTPPAEPHFIKSPPALLAAAGFGSFVLTYLWPALLALGAWVAYRGVEGARDAASVAWGFLLGAAQGAVSGVAVFSALLLAGAVAVYLQLRRQEEDDWISDRAPDPATHAAVVERENHYAHNHMVSVTERKPGWLRAFTLRFAFWTVATLGPRRYPPGHLRKIGTIHFARWITPPGSRDLIFFSNFGGSWEAYLEDFITLAHSGLTAVWSNTVGFPKTRNLFHDGATDGERFKRFARQGMHPTRFWYSAYPDLVTDMIRANAAIRRGLAGALTEDDAARWLSRFGSALRPDHKLVTSDIQSLVFGGLGFLPFSGCVLWRAPEEVGDARRWLRELGPHIAYNDGRRVRDDNRINAVIQLAISAPGLRALGLAEEGVGSFPPAFLQGMSAPQRARILGDIGDNSPEGWAWGHTPPDLAILVYGQTAAAYKALAAEVTAIGRRHGAALVATVPLQALDRDDHTEPFGFVDGSSQPVIRGTYKGLKSGGDPMHLVEPGEFIVGYPDNRGNIPPGPRLPAIFDPGNLLPVYEGPRDVCRNDVSHARDLGRDGSYLVLRQLEQDPQLFQSYCEAQAENLKDRLGAPYRIDADFIAAKLMGRWRNGSALVRAPYSASKTDEIMRENSFRLGEEDPEGLRCPFGSHIRRTNPRDSLDPGSQAQIDISNRHRILRVGRKYAAARGQKPGLLFACLNGDLERQFEFVQQTWALGHVISLNCPITLAGERDPILAGGGEHSGGFTIPTRDGPLRLAPPPRFVTTRGGGYFFLPGRKLVSYLTEGDTPHQA